MIGLGARGCLFSSFFAFSLISCSTPVKDSAMQPISRNVRDLGEFEYNDAKDIIESRLKLLDQFSIPKIDPYQGVNTLPDKCLVENLPQPDRYENNDAFLETRHFYSSPNLMLGHCPLGSVVKTRVVMWYCKLDKKIIIEKLFYNDDQPWRKVGGIKHCPTVDNK